MSDDYPERLLTHYLGDRWCAPLGQRLCPVALPGDGGRVGHLVLAGPEDLGRARHRLKGGMAPPTRGSEAANRPVLPPTTGAPSAPLIEVVQGIVTMRIVMPGELAGHLLPYLARGWPCLLLATPAAALSAVQLVEALHRAHQTQGRLGLLYVEPEPEPGSSG
ncbi:hypothetical protein ACFQXB_04185 [Plastorhodobacter daqingensis]|uniref:Uncharacterized protein n=1 Tax=Plastorhodobacter daqingensis TaxID=1387281 RepID=A0ABW2UIM4_9RHOB